jgi:hypothetical protein
MRGIISSHAETSSLFFAGLLARYSSGMSDTINEDADPAAVFGFDEEDCLRVALELRLPIKLNHGLPVPVDTHVTNPIQAVPDSNRSR